MPNVVSQGLPGYLPAAGLQQVAQPAGNLGLTNYGLQPASFTARANNSYIVPTGGTVILPAPTGGGAFITFTIFNPGVCTLSGTLSLNGVVVSTVNVVGGQTLTICDATTSQGWC